MHFIRPPAYHGKYSDRFLDLQREIDTPLVDLVSAVCRAGWGRDETLAALIEVADNIMLADVENRIVEDKLKALRQARR